MAERNTSRFLNHEKLGKPLKLAVAGSLLGFAADNSFLLFEGFSRFRFNSPEFNQAVFDTLPYSIGDGVSLIVGFGLLYSIIKKRRN